MSQDRAAAEPPRAIHARVSGTVQGVGFRYTTQRAARELGLAGWVRNRSDGTVELWAQGRPADVDRLVAYLRTGPLMARVTAIDLESVTPRAGLDGFTIKL